MTGNIKPHSFACLLHDVAIVGDFDGLDARAQALQSPDDVGHIQCLSRRHDACLEQLQARMRDDRDFLLQNAPLALVERVEVWRARRPHQLPPSRRARRLDGGGAVGGSSVL